MSRLAVLAVLVVAVAGCGCGSKKSEKPAATGAEKGPVTPPPTSGSDVRPPDTSMDAAFQLQPEEGTLAIDSAASKAGAETTVNVKLTPGAGYHIATDFPIKITLLPLDGVTLPKKELTAGGKDKVQGDAQTLTEQLLAFGVKLTADKPGTYNVKGFFKFGVCDKESCHPKKQPITLQFAVN
jgi:hypothetical protein